MKLALANAAFGAIVKPTEAFQQTVFQQYPQAMARTQTRGHTGASTATRKKASTTVVALPTQKIITSVALSSDGCVAALGVETGAVAVFDVRTKRRTSRRVTGLSFVTALAMREGWLCAGGAEGLVLWPPGKTKAERLKGVAAVRCLSFAGDTLLVGCDDGTTYVVDPVRRQVVHTLESHDGMIFSAVGDAKQKRIVSLSAAGVIAFWNAQTGKRVARVRIAGVRAGHLALDESRRRVLAVVRSDRERKLDGVIQVLFEDVPVSFDLDTGKVLRGAANMKKAPKPTSRGTGYRTVCWPVFWDEPSGHIVGGTGQFGGTDVLAAWGLEGDGLVEPVRLVTQLDPIWFVSGAPEARRALAADANDATVIALDALASHEATRHGAALTSLGCSDDGRFVLCIGPQEREVRTCSVWDTTTKREILRVARSSAGTIRDAWLGRNGTTLHVLRERALDLVTADGRSRTVAKVRPDDGYAASSGGHLAWLSKATLTRVELASGKVLPPIAVDGLMGPLAVGDASLVACTDRELVRLRWKDGRETGRLPLAEPKRVSRRVRDGQDARPDTLLSTPDGRFAIGLDHEVRVWDFERETRNTLPLLARLGAAVTQDGRLVTFDLLGIAVFDLARARVVRTHAPPKKRPTESFGAAALLAGGDALAVTLGDVALVYPLGATKPAARVPITGRPPTHIAGTPRHLVLADGRGELTFLDVVEAK